MRLKPPLKWPGGKHYLAARIVSLFPPHTHYVEPYAGGLSVLLAKDPEGVSEVVNDLDTRLTNFWRVLQCDVRFAEFCRAVEATPFSEVEWQRANCHYQCVEDFPESKITCVNCAARFFVDCRQSLAGRRDTFAPLSRTRTRRGMNEQASAWLTAVEGLPAVHERLKRVVVLNRDALEVLRQQDGPKTLFYLDPPYLHETRATTSEYGAFEMGDPEHEALLMALGSLKGKAMLSGYRSRLYDEALRNPRWTRHDFEVANHASGGDSKRRMTECLWVNW